MFKELIDRRGNKLFRIEKDFYLYLKNKGETRKIGALNNRGQLFIRRNDKHIYQKLDAYGFNANLLRNLDPDMHIVLKEESGRLLHTSVRDVLEFGKYLDFNQDGFEMQIFLPRNLFIKSKNDNTRANKQIGSIQGEVI